jgi:hypothetical protein
MNIAMIGLGVGAVIGGAVGVNKMMTPPIGAGVPTPPAVVYASSEVAEKTITLPVNATVDTLAQELGRVAGKPVHAYWDVLEAVGVSQDTVLGVPLANVSVETALMLANERLGKAGERIACRVTGDLLEVSTLHHFDRRDITLVAYDVAGVIEPMSSQMDRADAKKEVQRLITGVIDAEQWKENGGDLAEMYLVGSKLFVRAPARFQPTVQWILAQLGSSAGAPAAGTMRRGVPILKDVPVISPLFSTPEGEQSLDDSAQRKGAPASHTVLEKDTWRSIAGARLGNQELWMALVWVNGGSTGDFGQPEIGRELRMPDAEAQAARYIVATDTPEVFRAKYVEDAGWWKRLVALNPRLEIDWVTGNVLRLPAAVSGRQTLDTGKGNAAMAANDPETGSYTVKGKVEHAGLYSMPRNGVSVLRAIAASGGKLEDVHEVVVSQTENGVVNVVHRLTGNDLRTSGAADPKVGNGQILEVK